MVAELAEKWEFEPVLDGLVRPAVWLAVGPDSTH